MNRTDLLNILKKDESCWLDYKEMFKGDDGNVSLIHDILCLSNADHSGDRYLIFGIRDGVKEVVGVENDSNRKTNAQLNDLIREKNFNVIPKISIETFEIENHKIDVIIITNDNKKPFYLTKDYVFKGKTIRAGVIYTRNGDTNTPLSGTADYSQIKKMWEDHFGLTLPPSKKILNYLLEVEDWSFKDESGYFVYMNDPNYTIHLKSDMVNFDEPWAKCFPDQRAKKSELEIKFNQTEIHKSFVVFLDGFRYTQVLPKMYIVDENVYSFYMIENSLDHLIDEMIKKTYLQTGSFGRDDFPKFKTEFEAEETIFTDYNSKSRSLIYWDMNTGYRIKNKP